MRKGGKEMGLCQLYENVMIAFNMTRLWGVSYLNSDTEDLLRYHIEQEKCPKCRAIFVTEIKKIRTSVTKKAATLVELVDTTCCDSTQSVNLFRSDKANCTSEVDNSAEVV